MASELITIAIDAMGGDAGPDVTVPACLRALESHKNLALILVGRPDALAACPTHPRLRIHPASEEVLAGDPPSSVLRRKLDSSMRVALMLLRDGEADGCVSGGNTGALMALSCLVVKTFPGIKRPAIMASYPTRTEREVRVLDLGANVDCTPQQLYQFAVMANAATRAVDAVDQPKIGLLNVGSEVIKGNDQVKQADALLSENKALNYLGYIEGNALFSGEVDVVVCDGFVGNAVLKACEGSIKLLFDEVRAAARRNALSCLASPILKWILKPVAKKLNTSRRNGGCLLGLKGLVMKSHGGASVEGYAYAIGNALRAVEHNLADSVRSGIQNMEKASES